MMYNKTLCFAAAADVDTDMVMLSSVPIVVNHFWATAALIYFYYVGYTALSFTKACDMSYWAVGRKSLS